MDDIVKPPTPKRDDPQFALNFKRYREDVLKMSREDLAIKLGCGASTLYNWEEKGPGTASPMMIQRASSSGGQYEPMPPSKRLYDRFVAFVDLGTTFEKMPIRKPNRSTTPTSGNLHPGQGIVTSAGLDLKYIDTADMVKELQRRGWKVTLTMG